MSPLKVLVALPRRLARPAFHAAGGAGVCPGRFPRPVGSAVLLAAIALLLTGCAGGRIQFHPEDTIVAARMTPIVSERVGNHYFVEATLNGHGPYAFVLDTGASALFISPEVAREVGLRPRAERVFSTDASGRRRQVGVARVRELRLGPAVFRDFDAVISPVIGGGRIGERAIAGLVGFSVFRDCALTVDYPAELVLLGGEAFGGGEAVKLSPLSNVAETRISVNGRQMPAIIDTGAEDGFNIPASRLSVSEFRFAPVPLRLATSMTRTFRQQTGRLAGMVRLGPHAFSDPIVSCDEPFVTIGAEVMRRFRVTLDQRSGQAFFHVPDGRGAATFESEPIRMSGVSLEQRRDDWRVADVVPDSPAEHAGVRVGDRVIQIDGVDPQLTPRDALRALLRTSNPLRLTVERDGRRLGFVVPIRVMVP